MECSVCLRDWNSSSCIPRILVNCGHSFCEECLTSLYTRSSSKCISCPTCSLEYQFKSSGDIRRLVKNISLLTIASEAETLKLASKQKNIPLMSDQRSEEEVKGGISKNRSKSEKVGLKLVLEINEKCKTHGLLVHSYVQGSEQLLCDKCIAHIQNMTQEIVICPIPQVCKELRRQIYSANLRLQVKKFALKNLRGFVGGILDTNPTTVEGAIGDHFQKLHEIVTNSELIAREKYKILKDTQSKKLESAKLNINNTLEKLIDTELDIRSLQEYEDQDIIFMTQKIKRITENILNTIPDLPVGDINLAFKEKKGMYDKLGNYILNNSDVSLLPLVDEDGKDTELENILLGSSTWGCAVCETINKSGVITCAKCMTFRALETYPNLLQNPFQVTEEEIGELEARRKEEKKLVCERDALTTSQGMHEGLWYIITSEWLAEWKSFIFNKSYPGVLVNLSPNKRVGVLPPGPISNHTLFLKARQSTQILKLNLHKNTDYRGVNQYVWEAYTRIYGGGPVIAREILDIYGEGQTSQFIKERTFGNMNKHQGLDKEDPNKHPFPFLTDQIPEFAPGISFGKSNPDPNKSKPPIANNKRMGPKIKKEKGQRKSGSSLDEAENVVPEENSPKSLQGSIKQLFNLFKK